MDCIYIVLFWPVANQSALIYCIHPFMHTFTQRRWCQPCGSSQGAVGRSQGAVSRWGTPRLAGDGTSNLPVTNRHGAEEVVIGGRGLAGAPLLEVVLPCHLALNNTLPVLKPLKTTTPSTQPRASAGSQHPHLSNLHYSGATGKRMCILESTLLRWLQRSANLAPCMH